MNSSDNVATQNIRIDVVNKDTNATTTIGSGEWVIGSVPVIGDQVEVWTEDFGIWELVVAGRKWFAHSSDVKPEFAGVLFVIRKEDLHATTQPG